MAARMPRKSPSRDQTISRLLQIDATGRSLYANRRTGRILSDTLYHRGWQRKNNIAQKIFNTIVDTELHKKLAVVGTDGTASMTGKYIGCIRSLEKLLNKPLQWVICLLHTNVLPLRHVFKMLDGTTKSPDSFSGPIGKSLTGDVSSWPVAANFKSIPNPHFVELP